MEIEKKIRNKVLRTNSRAKVSMNRLKILITVVGRAKADFYMDHIQSFGVNMQMVLFGQGTAPREIATAMGLADSDRAVIISVIGENQLAAALDSLAEVKNARERMWLRLLPAEGIEERCAELGFDREKLLLERPPYSVEQNIAHLKKSGASVLLTKESGRIGGYPEKAKAARACGVRMLTLARPAEEGADFGKVWQMIKELEK